MYNKDMSDLMKQHMKDITDQTTFDHYHKVWDELFDKLLANGHYSRKIDIFKTEFAKTEDINKYAPYTLVFAGFVMGYDMATTDMMEAITKPIDNV